MLKSVLHSLMLFIVNSLGNICYGCKRQFVIKSYGVIMCNACNNKIISITPIIMRNTQCIIHALGKYEGSLKNVLTAKYATDNVPYRYFGKTIAEYLQRHRIDFDVIIPVPQHPMKHMHRLLNHSYELAYFLNKIVKKEIFNDVICKKIHSQSQLSYKDRIMLDKFTFSLHNAQALTDKRILLLDDVLTTGSTIKAMVKTIQSAKPADIIIMVIART